MTSRRVTPKVSKQVAAVSTSYVTMLTTPWMLMVGSDYLRVSSEIRALSGGHLLLAQRPRTG